VPRDAKFDPRRDLYSQAVQAAAILNALSTLTAAYTQVWVHCVHLHSGEHDPAPLNALENHLIALAGINAQYLAAFPAASATVH
jgi:hypothetical protein